MACPGHPTPEPRQQRASSAALHSHHRPAPRRACSRAACRRVPRRIPTSPGCRAASTLPVPTRLSDPVPRVRARRSSADPRPQSHSAPTRQAFCRALTVSRPASLGGAGREGGGAASPAMGNRHPAPATGSRAAAAAGAAATTEDQGGCPSCPRRCMPLRRMTLPCPASRPSAGVGGAAMTGWQGEADRGRRGGEAAQVRTDRHQHSAWEL
mmetsp:Transcript_14178/g.40761  ORF Transcript_14178/g.40761 Transcript_14178/m.40761 type:complete len:211 (-) Transcript_14178:1599-2231(-)